MEYLHSDKLVIFVDAFNTLCGDLLGSGVYRDVFECKLRPDLVVKVETKIDYRSFVNVSEMKFWDENREYKAVSQWLAPCEFMSPDGRILLQKRVQIAKEGDKDLPAKLPKFITDRKFSNFGWLDGRLVVCDYGMTITHSPLALTKADFW